MEEYSYEIKIPKDRVAVLIGSDGKTKNLIEKETNSTIKIDSDAGDVFISGQDALGLFDARHIIKAIARGFNPEFALLLLKQDYSFELINIQDFVGKMKSQMDRIKGRVIGSKGKSRRTIEQLTDCHLSVYGKTIGIIGRSEDILNAKKAVESLLSGSTHASVFKFLENKRRQAAFDQSF